MKKDLVLKTLFFLLLIYLLPSCTEEVSNLQKEVLTKEKLSIILKGDEDFKMFLEEEINKNRDLKVRLSNLTKTQKSQLDAVLTNFSSFEEFSKNADQIDQTFVLQLLKPSKKFMSSMYLERTLLKLNTYEYKQDDFNAIMIDSINEKFIYERRIASCGSTCSDLEITIYVDRLNYYYFGLGFTLDSADKYATLASSWAYVGCMHGCQQ